jgi:sirohydrochlorin cobaltochelatase
VAGIEALMQAIVLFAHGSRDPLWHRPIQAVAQRIRARSPQTQVECAYLELTAPDLPSCVASLRQQGCTSLRILPMFLGIGKHAREDLPILVAELRASHPELHIDVLPSVGEHPALIALMSDLALGGTTE